MGELWEAFSPFVFGTAVGFLAGVVFDDAWEMFKKAWTEMHPKNEEAVMIATRKKEHNPPITVTGRTAFFVISTFGLVQVLIGVFVIVDTVQGRQFQACESKYNQDFAEAYRNITEADREADDALYRFLRAAPPVVRGKATPEETLVFRDRLDLYIGKYGDLRKSRSDNPFPRLPRTLCGPIPE